MINVEKKMACLPPMTGNGNHTTYTNLDMKGDGADGTVLPSSTMISHLSWSLIFDPGCQATSVQSDFSPCTAETSPSRQGSQLGHVKTMSVLQMELSLQSF